MKKFFILALAVLLLAPAGGFAWKTQWESVSAKRVWNYDTYRVAELNLPAVVDGLFNLGDNVLVQTTASSCAIPNCNERDAWILRNGSAIRVPNVPKGALDLENYLKNDGRVVWAAKTIEDRYVVVELDLVSGQKINLTKEFFLDGVETMDVMVAGSEVFMNPTFSFDEPSRVFKQAAVFRYSAPRDGAELITKRYHSEHEELLDVDLVNRRILTKMTFQNGDKELFITKLESGFAPYGEFDRIVGSYTPKHEDIVGAHFRPDGAVEYFRLFDRHLSTTDNGVKTVKTASLGENLNWLRQMDDTIFVEGDNMVYVNMAGELTVSNANFGVLRAAPVDRNPVAVNEDYVFYVSTDGLGHVYDLRDGSVETVDYRPVDAFDDAVIGVNPHGSVLFTNTSVDVTMDMGFGTSPAMSDNRHIYWRGVNGGVFEATVASNPARVGNYRVEAVKIAESPVVYLVDGINRWTFTNEDAFFSWFKNWDEVKTVSPTYLTRFRDRGPAALSPGARIKSLSDARVYIIGHDNKLHWIVNERVAYDVYGPSWNKSIIDVPTVTLVSYQLGSTVEAVEDWQEI